MKLRDALRKLRKELKLSQSELAEILDLNFTTVNRWENEKSTPNRSTALAILSLAKSRNASTVCIEELKAVLFPTGQAVGIDDLKFAEMDRINQFLNDSSNIVVVTDKVNYRLLYVNRQAAIKTNQTVEEANGKTCYEYFRHRTTPCEECNVNKLSTDKYTKEEYTSPLTSRHYISRGRLIDWKGRPAHIKYITDISEYHNLQKSLEQERQILGKACQFAEMWVFKYNVKRGVAYPDERLQKQFGLPAYVENFPEEVFEWDMILPEYIPAYRALAQKIKNGASQSEGVIRARYHDGRVHWLKFRYNTIQYDSMGNPEMAICTAQPVDNEKRLEASLEFEKKTQNGGDKSLLGYAVTNLTLNRVEEYRNLSDNIPPIKLNMTFEGAIEMALKRIVLNGDKYLKLHNRQRLLDNYENGITTESIEFQRKMNSNEICWQKNVLRLVQNTENGDVLLCEYCYDINDKKLLDGVTVSAVQYNFEFYGTIYFNNEQLTMMNLTGNKNGERIVVSKYYDEVKRYSKKWLKEDERDVFYANTDLKKVKEKLEKQKHYSFVHYVRDKNGKILKKYTRYTYFDKQAGIGIVTRMDLSEE